MSEFAFFRFMSLNLLTSEEKEHKDDIIDVTEQVLDAEGIECDSKVAKLPQETINKILSEVRKRRRKAKQSENVEGEEVEVEGQKESPVPAR
jgi:aspartate carbamoyltransferase regulatory subunit